MSKKTVNTNLMKALAHPLRQRILMELNDRVASPSELAEEIGEPLGNVSYHVRMLVDLECIELVSTTPRRGALEHHYKAIVRPLLDASYSTFPTSTKRALIGDVLKEIWSDVGAAADADSFDGAEVHVTRQPIPLDADGWAAVAKVLDKAVNDIEDIKAKSSKRLAKADAEAIESVLAILHFRAGAAAPAKPKRARKAPAAKR